MKRKVGIGLLIILNLTFIYVIIIGGVMSFGLIVAYVGPEKGLEIANSITNDVLAKLTFLSTFVLIINYFLAKKMITNTRSAITSLAITAIGIIVFIPFFMSAKKSYLNYQKGADQLQLYIDRPTITKVQIITHPDAIQIEQLDDFISRIGRAKYKRGFWKYRKSVKLIFTRTDGRHDSIFTNGKLFGPYKNKYFETDDNVIEPYIIK